MIFILSGCSTSYKPHGFGGGYTDMNLGNNLYKVSFRGNGYTSSETVGNYFLRRCAEITVENGFEYFAFIEKNQNSSSYNYGSQTTGSAQSNGYGGFNYTSDTDSFVVKKHRKEGVIKLFKSGNQPEIAYEAATILKNFKE